MIVNRPLDQQAKGRAGYCAYLVRLWQESPATPWRASAQSAQSEETVRFADVEELFAFLRSVMVPALPAAHIPPAVAEQEPPTA